LHIEIRDIHIKSMREPKAIIIDDEEDLLDLYEYNFAKNGFQVITFSRAKQALAYLENNSPDIILCDWMMPEMDGLDFCKEVKSKLSMADIPFLMVTCRTEKSAVRQALAAGVSDFISKPVGMQELIDRVNFILSQNRRSMTG
jgi:two-component system phosphate regulon response regulator PhoB